MSRFFVLSSLGAIIAMAIVSTPVIGQEEGKSAEDRVNETAPLRPGEYRSFFANGCAFVSRLPSPDRATNGEWTGSCWFGLAHGFGTIIGRTGRRDANFAFGREIIPVPASGDYQGFIQFLPPYDDGRIRYNLVALSEGADPNRLDQPGTPVNQSSTVGLGGFTSGMYSFDPQTGKTKEDTKFTVGILVERCRTERDFRPLSQRILDRGELARIDLACRKNRAAPIHAVEVREAFSGQTAQDRLQTVKVTLCSEPTSLAGCAPEYAAAVAPVLAQAREVIAAHRDNAENEAGRIEAFMRPWMDTYRDRVASLRFDEESAALARKQAAEAEQAKFAAGLETLGVGALFALADEMAEAGDTAKARQALRTLIQRFPDNALAAQAAAQLGKYSDPRSSSQSTIAQSTSPTPPPGLGPEVAMIPAAQCPSNAEIDRILNAQTAEVERRYPVNNAWSSAAHQRNIMFRTMDSKRRIQVYQNCAPPGTFDEMFRGFDAAFAVAERNCRALSSNPEYCIASYPD